MKAFFSIILILSISAYAASAGLENGGYIFFSNLTGEVLQVQNNSTAEDAIIDTARLTGGMNQMFVVATKDSMTGLGTSNNGENPKFINVPNSSKGNVDLKQHSLQSGMNYFFRVIDRPHGLVALQSRSSGKLITTRTSPNSNVYQSNKDLQPHQLFRALRVDAENPQAIKNGANYYFIAASGGNYAFDIHGISKEEGAALTAFPFWAGPNQYFRVKKVSTDYYNIINVNSGLALAVSLDDTNAGSGIIQAALDDGDEYEWSFNKGSMGTYEINSKLTGLNAQVSDRKDYSTPITIENVNHDSGRQNFWCVELK